ncbi:MAG: hypothetical protein NC427_06875 [Ruminococcus flavefaciens]|nr:hypothetical protein [Ruminococcus flavefaciens]
MINKISGNDSYIYTKPKKIDVPNTGEKFNLDYRNGEMPSEAKDKKEVSDQERQQSVEKSGVRLELSNDAAQRAAMDRQGKAAEADGETASERVPLLETLRSYVTAAIAAVKEFVHKIWNDPKPEEMWSQTLDSGEVVYTAEKDQALLAEADPGDLDHEIRQSLQDGNMDRVISLLTDNGRRSIAKNSSLLTSYDKNGRMVEPDASNRERALHGDRNSWIL